MCRKLLFLLILLTSCSQTVLVQKNTNSVKNPLGKIESLRSQYGRHLIRIPFSSCPVCNGSQCTFCNQTGEINGYIDWSYGYCFVEGIGLANGLSPQKKLMAERGAKVVAHRNAVKLLSQIFLDESKQVGQEIAEDIYTRSLVHSEKIRESSRKILEQKRTVSVLTLKIPLYGRTGLMHHLYPRYQKDYHREGDEVELGNEEEFSYLVLDARGQKVTPGLFPRIRSTEGTILYDSLLVQDSLVQDRGIILYVSSNRSKKIKSFPYQKNLEASYSLSTTQSLNPLQIEVHQNTSAYQIDFVVSEEEGTQITANGRILKTAQIIVLVD